MEEEEEEEEDFEVPTLIDGFRSRYKNGRNSSIASNYYLSVNVMDALNNKIS